MGQNGNERDKRRDPEGAAGLEGAERSVGSSGEEEREDIAGAKAEV